MMCGNGYRDGDNQGYSRDPRPARRPRPRARRLALLAAYRVRRRAERVEALRSEREATHADSASRYAAAEEREWEAVLGDAVDRVPRKS
jgi:hypothetical protein